MATGSAISTGFCPAAAKAARAVSQYSRADEADLMESYAQEHSPGDMLRNATLEPRNTRRRPHTVCRARLQAPDKSAGYLDKRLLGRKRAPAKDPSDKTCCVVEGVVAPQDDSGFVSHIADPVLRKARRGCSIAERQIAIEKH
jgi:hypothetical protein